MGQVLYFVFADGKFQRSFQSRETASWWADRQGWSDYRIWRSELVMEVEQGHTFLAQ